MVRSSLEDLLADQTPDMQQHTRPLQEARSAAKLEIKRLSRTRKALSKDDLQAKASLSADIKAAKKKLNGLERELLETLSGQPRQSEDNTVEDYRGDFTISENVTTGWDRFARSHGASPYHRLDWQPVFADVMGREVRYLSARDSSNEILGILPICITRSRVFGKYGVSLPYVNYGSAVAVASNVEQALIDYAFNQLEAWQISHIELRDVKPRAGMVARTDKVCMILSLADQDNFQQLLNFLGSKVRAQINKALSSDIRFAVGGTELLKDFYTVFSRNMRDLGTPVYAQDLFASILEILPNEAMVVVGYLRGSPVSCAFLLQADGAWEIPWASTIRSANKIAANMALYARVLQEVLDRGAHQFDFGRSSVDAPTFKFKKQWRAEPQQLYWYYSAPEYANSLTTSSAKYQMAIQAWRKLPLPVANALGPHLVKHLP